MDIMCDLVSAPGGSPEAARRAFAAETVFAVGQVVHESRVFPVFCFCQDALVAQASKCSIIIIDCLACRLCLNRPRGFGHLAARREPVRMLPLRRGVLINLSITFLTGGTHVFSRGVGLRQRKGERFRDPSGLNRSVTSLR